MKIMIKCDNYNNSKNINNIKNKRNNDEDDASSNIRIVVIM